MVRALYIGRSLRLKLSERTSSLPTAVGVVPVVVSVVVPDLFCAPPAGCMA